ncbi:hypothetical protein OUZ56_032853 [Daphnia magna]|uniref:Uncharacterized protein n=1 Tax=Daphnia magna TaxID=35525 RepID=A0ABR0BA32_9CRUS|nr:hypothetical protein OUZ56_032853 [Daphnia magna]
MRLNMRLINRLDMEYNNGGDIASDNSFDNEDHQEQQLRIGSDSSNTDDHSLSEYESGFDGDFNLYSKICRNRPKFKRRN